MNKKIRKIELSDAKAVSEIYAPFVSSGATSFETEAPDAPAIEKRIGELTVQYPWLVFEAESRVLGYAYACLHRARRAYQWCVEVSVYVHESARRCGVGQALYASLFEILRRQGYVNVYAGITLPNPGSVGLHESLGFVPVGVYPRIGFKFGEWHDVMWFRLRLSETSTPIAEPFPAAEFLADGRIAAVFEREAQAVRYVPNPRS